MDRLDEFADLYSIIDQLNGMIDSMRNIVNVPNDDFETSMELEEFFGPDKIDPVGLTEDELVELIKDRMAQVYDLVNAAVENRA